MIDKISLKFGSSTGQSNLEIDVTPITVFVGPNNSGKSKVLIEIEFFARRSHGSVSDVIIKDLVYTPLSKKEIEEEIDKITSAPNTNEHISAGTVILAKVNAQSNQASRISVDKQGLIDEAQNPTTKYGYYSPFVSLYTLRLNGTNRLNLLKEQPAGDLQATPANHLAHLFVNNELRQEVRRIIFDAFGKYYVIDPTNIGKLRIRLADRAPKNEREEKGWEKESVDYHSQSTLIDVASDGVKAFSGIITTLLAGDPKITLIDEPEAFLHPGLASKLGKEIGRSLRNSKKRLFVSTHSSSFLMGCIQSGAPLNIVRLTYKNEIPTARLLPQDKILHLMRHPLLRSTGVLNGLFYETVIVTEADSDRAFYQEINERLLSQNNGRGITNCLFINAQNKQTVWDIVRPLRELGIPAIGIVDIDVVKEGGQVFTKLLENTFIPQLNHQAFQNQRKTIYDALELTKTKWKVAGGINVLDRESKEACSNFFDQLEEYGIFVVRNGELESWLKYLGATGHGSNWLIEIFEKMGETPDAGDYVKPQNDDVWMFMDSIQKWLENKNRKGIPQ
ncbi:ATP-binding protein [Mucilaginibacter mali]|uniref:ATP-binding protein n=1 Tax=Mucilaginibacter mali TaxID=2740462 RepID=A0A7D4QDC8_9SPHI|nr:ATP-binding protein [Mucilaginibacter mali]QKJ31544.1 ATP-binding protein [Mucilaginibacter mali]